MTLRYSQPTGAEAEARRRIAARGPITFAEFMDVALYWPDGGYYASRTAFGASGDYYTAPLTHPAFGALVARQVGQMRVLAGPPESWWVVEAGAGAGRLSIDVLAAFAAPGIRSVAIDRCAPQPPLDRVAWVRSTGLPLRGVRGVVLANELFDAMPVHRVTVVDGALREIRVGIGGDDRFADVLGDPTPGTAERLAAEDVRLAEGHRGEVCLELASWFEDAAKAVDSGYLLLFDYGHDAGAHYDPSRRSGTLRTYYQHTMGMDPYAHVGRQDITVHVDVTALHDAAVRAGWTEAGTATQAAFLRNLGRDAMRMGIADRRDLPTAVRVANTRALDTLAAPDGMGGFRAMAFAKGVPSDGLWGFEGGAPAYEGVVPLATPSHMPFGPAQQAYEFEVPSWEDLLR